jgi:hypothetical protein
MMFTLLDENSWDSHSVEADSLPEKGGDNPEYVPQPSSSENIEEHDKKMGTEIDESAQASTTERAKSYQSKRAQNARVMKELAELLKSNFTRNVTIVVQRGEPPRSYYIPLRAKVDTGCDKNLISMQILKERGYNPEEFSEKFKPVEEDLEVHFEGINGFAFSPEYAINLTWYYNNNMSMQQGLFYVVEESPFDMLFGSEQWKKDLKNPVLFTGSREKGKGL